MCLVPRYINYRGAIREALHQEMERDDSVFTYGIDVADHKRIFGTTDGLLEEFGAKRCFSTPLSEDAMTGFGLGAAINGLRPVHVHMRVDFLLLAMNQLANMVSSYHYGSGGTLSVPLVIRAIIGRGWGQAYQHSKSMHSVFAHIPGLKVVMPSTSHDAKGMLIAAIRDDNPVLFIEHRWLYDAQGEVDEDSYIVPLEGSSLLREGSNITVISTSWMNVEAIKAAEIMSKRGMSAEVIDARSISHFDVDMMAKSIIKTGRCVIADNDWLTCGFSAELIAQLTEKCFRYLKAPISRIGFEFTPCPCTRPLENAFYPNAINIVRGIEKQLDLSETDLSGEDFYSYENKFKGPF